MLSLQNIILAALFSSVSLSNALPILFTDFMDLEARDGSASCYPLDIDQVKKLPGWSKIEQYAKDNWGEGGVNIVTNPPEYTDRAANACLNVAQVNADLNAQPQCTEHESTMNGEVSGTSATITFKEKTGTEQSASWTVTRSSEVCNSVSFSVGISLPMGISAGMTAGSSTTIKNERTSTFSSSSSNVDEHTIEYRNDDGKQCKMKLKTKSCTSTARGKVPIVASGFVWFNYDDKRASKKDPKGGEHYKWDVDIASVLSEAERTSFIEFQGPVKGTHYATYKVDCEKSGGAETKPKPPSNQKPAAKPKPGPQSNQSPASKPKPKPRSNQKPATKPKPKPKPRSNQKPAAKPKGRK